MNGMTNYKIMGVVLKDDLEPMVFPKPNLKFAEIKLGSFMN